ncbi:MAG: MFS transporter, partial [Acidobacteriota bacterium]|nr:MFS transporter [Acidobacteriota bacterium]
MQNVETANELSPEDKRRDNRDKLIYPMQQLAHGVMQSFFSTYLNNLMTLVYIFPIGVAGFVEAMGQALGWVVGPVSGAMIDRFSFKKSKYWPWIIIGSIGGATCWVVIFILPAFVSDPTRMVIPVAIIILVRAMLEGPDIAVGNILYARLARDGKLRSYLAMWGKIGRDGM